MSAISQRDLRNDSAEVLRAVEQGQSYTVTRHGVPVASLSPITEDAGLRCVRPARRRVVYSDVERITTAVSSEEIMADLRDDR